MLTCSDHPPPITSSPTSLTSPHHSCTLWLPLAIPLLLSVWSLSSGQMAPSSTSLASLSLPLLPHCSPHTSQTITLPSSLPTPPLAPPHATLPPCSRQTHLPLATVQVKGGVEEGVEEGASHTQPSTAAHPSLRQARFHCPATQLMVWLHRGELWPGTGHRLTEGALVRGRSHHTSCLMAEEARYTQN